MANPTQASDIAEVAGPRRYASLSKAEQEQNTSQLIRAAKAGDMATLSRLLEEDLVDVNGRDHFCQTALLPASDQGRVEAVQRLLEAGADVHFADIRHQTPLYVASSKGHVDVVELLLQARADVHQPFDEGWTTLHTACDRGHVSVVELLLQAGADANRSNDWGTIPHDVVCLGFGADPEAKPAIEYLLRQAGEC